MFEKIVDGVRFIGWVIYAGMNYLISAIYDCLMAVPNILSSALNDDTVNTLFTASRNLFIIFVGLMIAVAVLSRLFDWNVNKLFSTMKKILLLSLILIAMPWAFTEATNITNEFINTSKNLMTSEMGDNGSNDFGVALANTYIYKNQAYSNLDGFDEPDEDPFADISDVNEGDILNTKIENEDGDDVYVYSYLNPILGIILNLGIIILLVLTAIKLYGYLYKIIVIKIWIPIKMIYDGFNDTPVSENIWEIVSAFTSFGIQLVLIPFSVILMDILLNSSSDNLFLQIVSILVSLWFMFTGVDYIQSKFQSSSGVPSVFEMYAVSRIVTGGINNIRDHVPSANDNSEQFYDKDIPSPEGGEGGFITTGREDDLNTDHEEGINPDDNNVNNNTVDKTDDNDVTVNDQVDNNDINTNSNVTDEDIQNNQDIDNEQFNQANKQEPDVNNDSPNDNNNTGYQEYEANNNMNQNMNRDGGDMNEPMNNGFAPTDKQVAFAESLGIETEGKNKYQLGKEIEVKTNESKRESMFKMPEYDQPKTESDNPFESESKVTFNFDWENDD